MLQSDQGGSPLKNKQDLLDPAFAGSDHRPLASLLATHSRHPLVSSL